MAPLLTYRMSFRSPLHVGERGVGLEVTRAHVPADTLFSALCSAWRAMYGVDALRTGLLDSFTQANGGSEPFFLSSAFPFAGSIRFFPKPLLRFRNMRVSGSGEKAFKRVRFVSERIFAAIINDDALTFHGSDDCVNGGLAWVTKREKEQLLDWTDDLTGEIVLWKHTVVSRVTLDRVSSASLIWHFGKINFADGAGLWFSVDFHQNQGEEFRGKWEAALRLLGDEGLGGERGAGHGLFEFAEPSHESVPGINDADRFVTLSPICPKNSTEVQALTGDGAAYELMPRRGWVTSPEASNLRRKMVWMFSEGSVLKGSPQRRPGRLVNLKPDACPHDVYRYGYAFPVGVNQQ